MRPDHCPERQPHQPHEWIGQALRVNCPGGMFVLAGTGSRSLQVADNATKRLAWDLTVARLEQRRTEHGDRLVVMSGLAEGYDACLAKAALELGVRLWAAIPNQGYLAHYWGRASLTGTDRLAEAQAIIDQAERVTYVMADVHGTRKLKLNGKHANFWRNDFMVSGGLGWPGADDFLVWNPTSKGTAHCVRAIKAAGKWRDDMVLSSEPAQLPLGGS